MHATKIGLAGLFVIGFCLAVAARSGAADDAQGPKGHDVSAAEQGFQPMFDGKTLDGWDGDPRLLARRGRRDHRRDHQGKARHGATRSSSGAAASRPTSSCKAEFRMPNRGLRQLRHPDPQLGRPARSGKSAATSPTWTGQNQYTGICYGENYRGILAQRGQKVADRQGPPAEGRGAVRRPAENWASSSRSTIGTSTTSSPRGTTSSRRSTAT